MLKPSSPGALSDGNFLTTESISSLVKGETSEDRSHVARRRLGKSKFIIVKEDKPNLSLKVF